MPEPPYHRALDLAAQVRTMRDHYLEVSCSCGDRRVIGLGVMAQDRTVATATLARVALKITCPVAGPRRRGSPVYDELRSGSIPQSLVGGGVDDAAGAAGAATTILAPGSGGRKLTAFVGQLSLQRLLGWLTCPSKPPVFSDVLSKGFPDWKGAGRNQWFARSHNACFKRQV